MRCRRLNLSYNLTNSSDGSRDEFFINISSILLHFIKDLLTIFLVSDFDQNLQFLKLDVDWVVKLCVERLNVVAKDVGLLLQNKLNVSAGNILEFWLK